MRMPLLLLPILSLVFVAAPAQRLPDSGVGEDELIERVVWPVTFGQARQCDRLVAADLRVIEDGRESRVTAVHFEQPPRVHAIMIDNSGSMSFYMDRLEKATVQYIRRAPPGEPVILSTFANNVLLEAGLSADRQRQIEAAENLPLGQQTALRDALYYTIRYLERRPERKVVILFTDSYDNASLGRHTEEQLIDLVVAIPDLTLHTIHLTSGHDGIPSDAGLLEQLSELTGGEYYRIVPGHNLGAAFRDIRHRLDREAFVTYEPLPFGEGPVDRADGKGYRLREVKIVSRRNVPCRVKSVGPKVRLVGTPPNPTPLLREVPGAYGVPESTLLADRQLVKALRFPNPRTWPGDAGSSSYFYVADSGSRLYGRTLDIMEEQGSRYDPTLLDEQGMYLLEHDATASFAVREFAVELPPVDVVLEQLRSPVDVLMYMLRTAGPRGADSRHPLFIHGQTWLELRPFLAEAIYRARPDYRAWAERKFEQRHSARIAAVLAEYSEELGLPIEELSSLNELLHERLDRPGPEHCDTVIGEWLGDVPAQELLLQLQGRIVNRMLRSGDEDRQRVELERIWSTMQAWFPPPTRSRVLTPLVPAYDPRRDVIGFFRVVVPRALRWGPPLDALPEKPTAAEMVQVLLAADEALARQLRETARVRAIEVVPLMHVSDRDGAYPLFESWPKPQPPHPAYLTRLELTTGDETVSLIGVHVRTSPTGNDLGLRCLQVDKGPARKAPLSSQVHAVIQGGGLGCKRGAFAEFIPAD